MINNPQHEERIRGGFDPGGAFGPTILFELSSRNAVRWFKDILVSMTDRDGPIHLRDLPGVVLQDCDKVDLEFVEGPVRRHLTRTSDQSFEWVGGTAYWLRCSQLVDALESRNGHQYLTDEVVDDALIEVSFGERHAGVS